MPGRLARVPRLGDLDEVALAWIAVGPVRSAAARALLARFGRYREAAGR